MDGRASLVQKLILGLLAIIAVGVVAVVVMFSIAISQSAPSCDQDDNKLCLFEQYFQSRVIASLDASGTAAISGIYGRAWDSACLVLPYDDADAIASRCTPSFRCRDRLAEAADQQYWRNNDSLWGLMLFSECRLALVARFQNDRMNPVTNGRANFVVDSASPTKIEVVKQKHPAPPEASAFDVRIILGRP